MKKVFLIVLFATASIANAQVRPGDIRDVSEKKFIEKFGSTDKAVKMFLFLENGYQSDSAYYQVVVLSEGIDMASVPKMANLKADIKILKIIQKKEARIGFKEKIEEHYFKKESSYFYLAVYKVSKSDVN